MNVELCITAKAKQTKASFMIGRCIAMITWAKIGCQLQYHAMQMEINMTQDFVVQRLVSYRIQSY